MCICFRADEKRAVYFYFQTAGFVYIPNESCGAHAGDGVCGCNMINKKDNHLKFENNVVAYADTVKTHFEYPAINQKIKYPNTKCLV